MENQKLYDLRDEFLRTWPLERVKGMSVEEYTNLNKKDSFCYWLEAITQDLGSIWGGSAFKFGIYKRKDTKREFEENALSDGEYAWLAKYGKTKDEAFDKVKSIIVDIIEKSKARDFKAIEPIDLGNATVNSYVPGDTALKAGDIVHLIQVDPTREIAWKGQGKVYQGVTLTHDLADIRVDEQSRNLDLVFQKNNIKDSINVPANNNGSVNNTGTGNKNNASNNTDTTMPSANVNPKTKSLLQGRLVAPALINGGSAYLLEGGLESFYQNTNVDKNKANIGSNGFANVRADNREVTTGSHVKLKGMTFDAGYAWNKPLGLGNLTYGIAAEYGYTRYTSHLDDGTRGKGKAWYLGANTFGNYLWNNGLYMQGSLRIGRVSGDYRSNDFVHANGNQVNYDSKSNYIAGHIGAGKIWQLGSLNSLDTYIKYFDSYTSSDKAKLNSGETYHFSSVRSQRGRIGVQYNHQLAKTKLHFGLAHEREWNGHVRAQYQGLSLPSPTMKGGTTLGEAGVNYQLGGKQLNTALQVYGGRQRGAGLHLGVKF